MISVYTGNGKGKTTSAIGDALQSLVEDKRILVIQFLKGSTYSGELTGLYRLGIKLVQFGIGCRWSGMIRTGLKHCSGCGECFRQNRNPEIALNLVQEALEYLKKVLDERLYDFIILDEISYPINMGFLNLDDLITILTDNRAISWRLTGRNMPLKLQPLSDSWFDLNAVKHPFKRGIKSRRGIEY